MLDDWDRDVCASVERVVLKALNKGSNLDCKAKQVRFTDPGMVLEVEMRALNHPTPRPLVRITIDFIRGGG